MSQPRTPSPQPGIGSYIFIIAIWLGLFAGIIEGVIFLTAQFLGRMMGVSVEILWISPLSNLFLFFVIGVVLAVTSKFYPRSTILRVAVFLLVFLSVLAWLSVALIDYIRDYALVILSLGIAAAITRRFQKAAERTIVFLRRSLPILIVIVLILWAGIQGGTWLQEQIKLARLPESPLQSPNVLFVVVDTLRADHLSSSGYERQTSPNIDRIGKEGVIFENAFSTSSYTLPSHVSIFTGQYNHQHGSEWDTFNALVDNPAPTIAEVLYNEGYLTAGFSANLFWVTGEQGFDRGFIHFEDYFTSIEDMVLRTAFGRMIEKQILRRLGYEDIPARKNAEEINSAVLDWIDHRKDTPYFIFINYMDTHEPYLPPQPFRGMYSELEEPGGILNCSVERCDPPLTLEERQAEIDAYDGAITYVDKKLIELLDSLKEHTNLENTIVIITSDHGEAFNEHTLYLHGNSLYMEEIHIPLIFWWPGQIPAGVAIEKPITNAAIPATLYDLLNFQTVEQESIESLRALWGEDRDQVGGAIALSEISNKSWKPDRAPVTHNSLKSVVLPDGHFILGQGSGIELYDWQNDPKETQDLSGEIENQKVFEQLILDLQSKTAGD